jgi:hypothetical protein
MEASALRNAEDPVNEPTPAGVAAASEPPPPPPKTSEKTAAEKSPKKPIPSPDVSGVNCRRRLGHR